MSCSDPSPLQTNTLADATRTRGYDGMWEQFGALLDSPTSANYLAVRAEILNQFADQCDRAHLDALADLVRAGRMEAAQRRMDDMNDAWVLSPAFHAYSAIVLRAVGQQEDAEAEAFMRLRCVQGLAETGDGSRRRPYRTTYPGDARELFLHLGLAAQCQTVTSLGHRLVDVMESPDGRQIWLQPPPIHAQRQTPRRSPAARRQFSR